MPRPKEEISLIAASGSAGPVKQVLEKLVLMSGRRTDIEFTCTGGRLHSADSKRFTVPGIERLKDHGRGEPQ